MNPPDIVVSDAAGYDAIAERFISARSEIGHEIVATWAKRLPAGASVIDIGCGHGAPITRTLVNAGLQVSAIDPSPRMVAAFSDRFPHVPVECEGVENTTFFGTRFDAAVAIGVIFLLHADAQANAIARMAKALRPGGALLFSAPREAESWTDVLTGRTSWSLGETGYHALLTEAGFGQFEAYDDAGGTHYYAARRNAT